MVVIETADEEIEGGGGVNEEEEKFGFSAGIIGFSSREKKCEKKK